MSVYKRGKIWWTKFTVNGDLHRHPTGCTKKDAALVAESKLRNEIALGNLGIIKREVAPILSSFLTGKFSEFISTASVADRTKIYYAGGVKMLLDEPFASKRLDQITGEDVVSYKAAHQDQAPDTRNQALGTLRRALRLAEDWGKIVKAPKIRLEEGRQRQRILTAEEEDRYLDAAPHLQAKTIATLMMDLGFRNKEVSQALVTDVDLEAGEITIRRETTKTDAGVRVLPITDRVAAVLTPYLQGRAQVTGWLFPSPTDPTKPVDQGRLTAWSEAAREAAGIEKGEGTMKFVVYSARHTALTNLGEVNDIRTVQVAAGHSNSRITERYVHKSKASIRAAFERKQGRPISGQNDGHAIGRCAGHTIGHTEPSANSAVASSAVIS